MEWTGKLFHIIADDTFCIIECLQSGFCIRKEGLPFFGQAELSRCAQDQLSIKTRFQIRQATTCGGLSDPKLFRCTAAKKFCGPVRAVSPVRVFMRCHTCARSACGLGHWTMMCLMRAFWSAPITASW